MTILSNVRNHCLGMVVILMTGAAFSAEQAQTKQGAGQAETKLRERLAVLEEIVKLEMAVFKQGEGSFLAVLLARRDVVLAKIEMTNDPNERIEVRTQHVQIAREIEELCQKGFEEKSISRLELLRAKAARLKAEADLADEQSRGQSSTK